MSSQNSTIQNISSSHRPCIPRNETILFHNSSFFKQSPSRNLSIPTGVREATDSLKCSTKVPFSSLKSDGKGGARLYNGEGFLYMELVRGVTLSRDGGTLSDSDKLAIFNGLRGLEQDASDAIFTNICLRSAAPFPDVKIFNDWLSNLPRCKKLGIFPPHPMRPGLPDNVGITFTHSDLHPSNSGWYPAYWEYCKARWTAEISGGWEKGVSC
ncbi:hypothetical protein BGW36DRAFT_434440 [Talaromyces proteolyticus]|uniref:Uncharacterized protein n=1 Tax=Talaromyces proteolyticus TaxID=1131652 RepID=A0AAD4L4E1_9EURO|nr:uncharacterized protein BGW36DRAFT_434440 [Talaromyces proteolyticus]KAH8704821.1 hypothetical protein BGW36DRAFT_434440 [Talaromyces proteolyticus]